MSDNSTTVRGLSFIPPTTAGTTAVRLVPASVAFNEPLRKGVLIKAGTGNAGTVYLGNATVTADTAATGGFPLSAGQSVTLPIDQIDQLYAIGSASGQIVNCILI